MTDPRSPFYGWNISDIARICQVDVTTARRWKRGARCPPKSAVVLILGDLGMLDAAWRGWRIRRGVLYSPEGWEFTAGEVLAVPLERRALEAARAEVRRLKAELSSCDQPSPDSWPEWVGKLTG